MQHFFLSTIFFIFLSACSTKVEVNDEMPQSTLRTISITPTAYTTIDDEIDESSGLEYHNGLFYSFNDSGGKPIIYQINHEGEIVDEINLNGFATNIDWEDIAIQDDTIFISDLGNNRGNRRDLVIYKIDASQLNSPEVETIRLTYADQVTFTNQNHSHSFDNEAMISIGETLYLFSKDWLNGNTDVFKVSIDEQEVAVQSIEQLQPRALITGGDYDATNQRLVLSGYFNFNNYLWIFEAATPNSFFTGNGTRVELEGLYGAQVEGVCFISEESIAFSTEKTADFDPQIFTVDVNDILE